MIAMWKTGLAAALAAASVGWSWDETSIPLDKLPAPVKESVTKRFPKAAMVEAAKETEGDKTEYEVTLKDGKSTVDVMLTPEGKITLIERTIAKEKVPKPALDAVTGKHPGAMFSKFESVTKVTDGKEELDYYEMMFTTADKKTLEVKVKADGTITETEEKKEKEEKEEKHEKGKTAKEKKD